MNPIQSAHTPMNPAFTAYRTTYAAQRSPHSSHWRGAKGSEDLMRGVLRARKDAALQERLRLLSLSLLLPLIEPKGGFPQFLYAPYQWGPGGSPPRLLDHISWYRRSGRGGPSCARNTVAIGEPYLPDEAVPDAIATWTPALAKLGLVLKPLSKDWLIHAPDNPTSQIFLVGHPHLIGCLA